jgi:hypothetical protein
MYTPQKTNFLQRIKNISLAIQRGNAASKHSGHFSRFRNIIGNFCIIKQKYNYVININSIKKVKEICNCHFPNNFLVYNCNVVVYPLINLI